MNIYDGGWWAVGSRAVPEKIFAKDGQLCIYQSKEKAEEEATECRKEIGSGVVFKLYAGTE